MSVFLEFPKEWPSWENADRSYVSVYSQTRFQASPFKAVDD